MAIVVIGGSGKDIGKTGLMCAVIAALPEFEWTAVKITGHDYPELNDLRGDTEGAIVREETEPGEETDTSRYLAAGARRALLVTRAGAEVPIKDIQRAIGKDRNVIFESNRIAGVVKPDVCLALMGGAERKGSFERLLQVADAVVTVPGAKLEGLPETIRRFEVDSVDRLNAEMVKWLRERLGAALPQAAG